MKGILNKFKGLGSSPAKKSSSKQPESPNEEPVVVEETQKPSTKFSFFPSSKKITSKTRHQIVKDYLNSTKFYKLLQALEKEGETDHEGLTSHNVYFKENVKPMASVLKEKLQCLEEVDLTSQEVAKLYRSYQNVSVKDETPLFCISVINSQAQIASEGPTLEYVYPDFKEKLNLDDEMISFLTQSLKDLGLPDASKNEDFVYFIIDVNRKKFEKLESEALQKLSKDTSNDHAVLYGISFSKQIPVPETGTVQKAVCILSRVPLFGHILAKLDPVTKCYLLQEDHQDTQILTNFYDNINSSLKEITINMNELLAGTCTKKLVYLLKSKLMTLWKALFLEKRVLVFSQSPGACSSFIHSLLALYPCLCHFKYHSKALNSIENHYSEYGLPLRFFHEDCPLVPYLKADDVESINSARGFLVGTSKNLTNVNWDILVDIDKNSIQFKNDAVKKALNLTKQDKEFIQDILKKVTSNNSAESLSWGNIESSIFNDVDLGLKGSEEWIRSKFYDYLKNFLTELEYFAYSASAGKLDSHIEDFNAYLTNKGQTEGETFDWKDEILSPEDETGSRKDGDETEDEEIGSPMSGRSRSSKGKRNPQAMSQDDLDDFVQRTSQIDIEEKKTGEEKEVKESKRWFRSPLKRDSKPPSEVKSPQDSKTVLKKELLPLKDSMKTLKKYGIDWILGWARTSNFECWLDAHLKMIGERSQEYRFAKNHVWCMENGDIYLGELRFGQKMGTGQFIDRQAKMVYSGDWEEDERNGAGKLVSLETGETIYEGNFSGNKRHGAGKLTQKNEKYTGAFNMEKYEGLGTLIDKDKNTYEGEFKEGFKWGMGKLQLANGDLYTGEFLKDKYHGKGQLVCKNGDFYSGDFQDGLKWGRGILQKGSGDTYEGQFVNDVYEGHGKLTQKDGHAFEGAFAGGNFSNTERGFIHYPNGSEYMGEIYNYKAHGYGTMTTIEGDQETVCYGIFDSDQLIEELSKVTVDHKAPNNVQKAEKEEPK